MKTVCLRETGIVQRCDNGCLTRWRMSLEDLQEPIAVARSWFKQEAWSISP